FISEDFLLHSGSARRLYHDFARHQPILDYHCHLPPGQIASNHQFADLYEIWLAGDHYKWRVMRWNGVAEELCTGAAPPFEKFMAFARTVPMTVRSPLYHWTHLELLRFFGVGELLDEESAPRIWEHANSLLAQPHFRARALLERCTVRAVCTTDDPADDLAAHRRMREEQAAGPKMFPTFRPDKAFRVDCPPVLNEWVARLEAASGVDCSSLSGLLDALDKRHADFHALGGRLSDHGLERCPGAIASRKKAARIYARALEGEAADPEQAEKFAGFLLVYLGSLDASRGWTKQLHLGALRNVNSRGMRALGPDSGFDSIGDWPQAANLGLILDAMNSEGALPKMVLYNLNPADNYVFATMAANFQEGPAAGKIQFGSGWWFLDQKEGMEWQMNALSNLGLLSRFVGMLT
ncbi:MAG: glucuronate isomerase, partial [Terrimicrobiaceae bacterium]|nr:glucuronate isomerase [Terrimicrobiaceae bacterium]